MELTSAQCRAQAAIQWDRAKNDPLHNVRKIAARAATAWEQQAITAEIMEARKARSRAIAQVLLLQRQRTENEAGTSGSIASLK